MLSAQNIFRKTSISCNVIFFFKGGKEGREEKRKENGSERSKKDSGLILIYYLERNYNFSRSLVSIYYLFQAFIKVKREEVGIYDFMEVKPPTQSGKIASNRADLILTLPSLFHQTALQNF